MSAMVASGEGGELRVEATAEKDEIHLIACGGAGDEVARYTLGRDGATAVGWQLIHMAGYCQGYGAGHAEAAALHQAED